MMSMSKDINKYKYCTVNQPESSHLCVCRKCRRKMKANEFEV